MKNYISIALTIICATSSLASTINPQLRDDWTPDPQCPYPGPGHAVYFPVEGDCTSYYECWDGVKYTVKCSDGLWWHPAIEDCDYPGNYCDGVDQRCTDGRHHFYHYPADCRKYIECYEGNAYQLSCPPGLYFSEWFQDCVNRGDSDCCFTYQC